MEKTKVEGEGGAIHQYSKEEVSGFAKLINSYLKDDELCKDKLPIDPETEEIFDKIQDGFIFAKMVEKIQPGTIDLRALNTKGELNIFRQKENLNLAINSAQAVGCKIISINATSIIEKKAHLILGILWQQIRLALLSKITLKDNPYLARLLKEDEELEDFRNLPAEDKLIRWFNFHLNEAGHDRRIANFSGDVKDGVNYTVLLNQLDSELCDKSGLDDDLQKRADKVIQNAIKLGVEDTIKSRDIISGNQKLNLLFTSLIYNAKHGLEPKDDKDKELFEKAKMLEENADPGDTREERAFRMWANSLDIKDKDGNPFFFHNLYDDCQDSIQMLKLMEKVGPEGVVDWKKVNKNPKNVYAVKENCKYCIEQVAKNSGYQTVNIGSDDLYKKNKKMVLAIFWQMARKHTLDTLGGISEDELLKWANGRVGDAAIKGFSDKSISTGKFFFALLKSIEERAIDYDYVFPGENDKEIEDNAKYIISVARRLNAVVFCVWEDIKDVKPKMMMVMTASLRKVAEDLEKAKAEKKE